MSHKPYVVGIAGGTCSGKSTLASLLAEAFSTKKVTLINMDRYFIRPSPTTIAPITRKEYVEHNHPSSLRLDELYADFHAACDGDGDLVIIEGLFALYLDEIRDRLDLKIFVDLESDERIVRRIKRFTAMGQTFEEVTDRYLDTVRFRHNELIEPTRWHADLVLNGNFLDGIGADVVVRYLAGQLDEQ